MVRIPGEDADDAHSRATDDFSRPTDVERLVSDIDLSPFLGRPADPVETPLPDPVPVSPATPPLLALRDLLLDPRFTGLFARALREADPGFREMFPRDASGVLGEFVRAMTWALETVENARGNEAEVAQVVEFARHLGADHRKLELSARHHERFGDALTSTLRHLAGPGWDDRLATTLGTVYRVLTTALREGAAAGHGPARVGATVVEVLRPTRDVVVVRLITDVMVEYHPGQYLSVLTPYTAGVWRRFSPAIPANPAGQIEFHVRDVPGGTLSGSLVRGVGVGDRWVLARPLGLLEVDRTEPVRDVLMIAGGTGIAPLRCLLMDMMRHGANPRVHLFYGARHPGDLYDLPTLVDLAATAPWLTIQPVSEQDTDPWWAGARQELPRTLHRRQTGTLVDVVTGWGSWADRQVLMAGSPEMLRATVRGMVAVGTPRENISFDRP
ncbi:MULTISPECIES: FAD-binding oxidoreductase [unclassified Dietzia]|uniref:FAD-binding oxidoreductase n=1 Tax=unclassified Dietzia TaxID=2617939 RepID=UPI000D218478|nr:MULTISPECIES: FAD-binding oxidoreductase [unclassified Dietzia]AVZ41305.1 oxidoreductase [Dietzia sp. JS16-p6b]QGW26009.1 oxidoreductase FAD-binding subunit [Dietzia sp. DQ12-45-1b]